MRLLSVIVGATVGALAGCAASGGGGERALTPAEREQLARVVEARRNGLDPRVSPCRLSGRAAQLQVDDGRYQGADAMGAKGCEPVGQ